MTDRYTLWQVVQATAVVLVLGFFLFATLSILNPPLLFILLWAVLLPYRGREGHSALVAIAAVLTAVWLLVETGSLLAPFFLALVLAYILDPLVDILEGKGISRTFSVLALTVPAVAALIFVFVFVVPYAFAELGVVLESLPVLLDRLSVWIENGTQRLQRVDVPLFDGPALVEQLRDVDSAAVVEFFRERQEEMANHVWDGVLGLGRGIGSVFTVLGYVVLTPVLTFYLIRDWNLITARMARLIPEARREEAVSFLSSCDALVSSYLRGQLLVAITIGLLAGVGLGIASFPYAASLGLMVGVFSLVPYLGLVLSLVPALFIALVSGSVGLSLLKLLVVYGTVQILDGTVITPRIVGGSVGIHPVWVVLALSVGGYFFGIVGLLVGVPAAAVTKLLIVRGFERYESSEFYSGTAGDAKS